MSVDSEGACQALELVQEFDNRALDEFCAQMRERYIRNSKILLIQTLQLRLDAFKIEIAKNRGYYVYPPTGLQALVRAVSERDFDCEILDLNFEFLKRIQDDPGFSISDWLTIVDDKLASFDAAIVGVTCIGVATNLFGENHPLTAVLRHVKRMKRHMVIGGGPIATDEAYAYLKYDICDAVIRGEGENKFNFLLDQLYPQKVSGTGFGALQDICFKHEGAVTESVGNRDTVLMQGNLVSTYPPIPIEEYHKYGSLNPFSRMAGIDTPFCGFQLNRGCRANCKFCGVPKFMGKGVRQVPLEPLVEEIDYLVEQRGIRHFELLDDDFLGTGALRDGVYVVLEHLKALRRKYPNISWSAGNGLIAASIDEHLMQLIHDSGCIGYRIGIESGNPDMLKRLRKPASLKSLRKFVKMSEPFPSIFTSGNYIIGLFGEETFGEMLDSFRLSCELNMDWASYSTYQFTSKTTSEVEKLRDDGLGASECIPVKDAGHHQIKISESLKMGTEIFDIDTAEIPSREQVKEIWFVFNFLSNYVNNRNLAPGGNPKKLRDWLQAIRLSYPDNAYMPLFSAYCHVLLNEQEQARQAHAVANANFERSDYWQKRFDQFELNGLLAKLAETPQEGCQRLSDLKDKLMSNQALVEHPACPSN